MTSITARGRLVSAQTANGVHLVLMKYLQSYTEAFSCVSRGGLCPVSIRSSLHRFMDKRNGSQDNSIDLAPSPTSPHPLHLPPNTLSVQRGKAGVCWEGVSVFKITKSCTMNPDSCLGGFISSCVSPCLDDRRKMRLQMLKFDTKLFLPVCVTLNYLCIPPD